MRTRSWIGWGSCGLALLAGGCGPARDSDPFGGGGVSQGDAGGGAGTAGDDAPGGDASGGDTSGSPPDGSADGDDGGIKLDVGPSETTTDGTCIEGECEGCSAVDLLFIIDNSVSMSDHQVALGQAFPTFADAIIDVLPAGTSLHVGVTSTTMANSDSGSTSNCVATGDNNQPASAFYVTPETQNNGINGAQGRLYQPPGQPPYFELQTGAGPQEVQALKDWFDDAANIGEGGSQVEMAAAAAGWAASPANDGTNAGFIRDAGAVLVLFFIQDEADQTPGPETEALIQIITAAKSQCGGMECVIGGGFVNQGCLPQVPLGGLFDALGTEPVVDTLPDEDDVTPQTFEPLLRDTLANVIAETCEQITPEG